MGKKGMTANGFRSAANRVFCASKRICVGGFQLHYSPSSPRVACRVAQQVRRESDSRRRASERAPNPRVPVTMEVKSIEGDDSKASAAIYLRANCPSSGRLHLTPLLNPHAAATCTLQALSILRAKALGCHGDGWLHKTLRQTTA